MRRTVVAATMLLVFLAPFFSFAPASANETISCANYDAWEWAQTVFESDLKKYSALDADNDGIACPQLPKGGFAPAIWTDAIPKDAQKATILRTIDGDTFEMEINGVSNRVRIYRADTPETQNKQDCGGSEATAFTDWALSWNDEPGVVYLEKDKTEKDRYGRELAYVWFLIDGHPYMLNHILINNGFAEDKDYGDRKYDGELKASAGFAKRNDLGVYQMCGAFGIPAPTVAQQPVEVPVQQDVAVPAQGSGDQAVYEAPAVVEQPVYVAPVAQEPVYEAPVVQEPVYEEPANSGCDPNYTGCVPIVSYDLNCPDIGFMVQVIGNDHHGFDRDKDGWGCESYG